MKKAHRLQTLLIIALLAVLWLLTSCKTYNVYIVESSPKATTYLPIPKENRFTSSFRAADSSFVNMNKLRKASKEAVEKANKQFKLKY